ncbi:MAG: hypothetical protein DRI81_11905 [Chloroflexi bacterium]|nr:MAG: hypothetical protein DRI81_11905 [Chloroflexota bacterium]
MKARRWGLVGLLLLTWALRLPPLLDNRFHPDEALYGYWGLLIGRGLDPWLATAPVYKPPLLPYLIAGSQALFGNSEFAVRLPGLAAGVLTVALVAALARSLYHDRWAAAAAMTCAALSSFAILFSATAFTDPLMVTLGLAACVVAARGRPGWAGLLAGLACATKQTGLIWLPLAILIQILNPQVPPAIGHWTLDIGHWTLDIGRWILLIGNWTLVILLMFAWDAARTAQGAESFWRMGVSGYGGLRLIWPQELWTRLRGWAEIARYLFASPIVNGVLLAGLCALVWRAATRRLHKRESLIDLSLVLFSLVYLLLHWLLAFPIWDRYLLPLMPVLSILIARILSLAIRHSPLIIRHSLFAILLISLAPPAWNAAHSRYATGGDHGAYDGIDEVAAFLGRLPEGAVVYQHWLGWHYAYHLFDAPVYLAYWPTPAWLARDVLVFGAREPRYVTFPSWESSARVERALAGVSYKLDPVLTTTRRDGAPSFTVYHIQPLSDP